MGTTLRIAASLVGALAVHVAAQTPATAQDKLGLFLLLEAGGYCMLGKNLGDGSTGGPRFGDSGCGPEGRIAFGGRQPLALGFDTWRLSARYEQARDSDTVGASAARFTMVERRFVADADATRPLGFSILGAKPNLLLGLRLVSHEIDAQGSTATETGQRRPHFLGAGPRIGWTSSFVLNDTVRLDSETALGALWGNHRSEMRNTDVGGAVTASGTATRSGFVFNYESNMALTFAPKGHSANGFEFALGVRTEYWFQQSRSANFDPTDPGWSRTRNGVTPFVRAKIPLQ